MIDQELQAIQGELQQRVAAALAEHAMDNRGSLLPFRLRSIAHRIVEALVEAASGISEEARPLGQGLNQQGLGLPSLLEAQAIVLETIARSCAAESVAEVVGQASRFFGETIQGFADAEAIESEHQHDEMERALLNVVTEHRIQEERFNHALSEISTPIIPVHEGILILPLIGSINSRRATDITERLLEAISASQAEIVIIDITGVPMIDTSIANHMLVTTRAANLLGSQVVLVGIGPEIAQTIVHLGVDLQDLVTLANLQSGIAYALRRKGLGIQPLNNRPASDE